MQNGKEITKVYYFPLTVTLFERTAYGNNVLWLFVNSWGRKNLMKL